MITAAHDDRDRRRVPVAAVSDIYPILELSSCGQLENPAFRPASSKTRPARKIRSDSTSRLPPEQQNPGDEHEDETDKRDRHDLLVHLRHRLVFHSHHQPQIEPLNSSGQRQRGRVVSIMGNA
jgi:hypothetical protein